MQPWHKMVADWLNAYDVDRKAPKNPGLLQVFYNNNLATPYDITGEKLSFSVASSHRRTEYHFGEIPNKTHAEQFTDSPILLLTCQVDVHDENLAVSVMGWTEDARCYVIDY